MASKPSSSGKRTNFSIFEIFFDLPHPAASSDPTPAKIVEPKESEHRQKYNLDTSELYTPQNISKITRFAFPEHDDRVHAMALSAQEASKRAGEPVGYLNKHDIYFYSFQPHHFTFAIKLSNGPSMNGHVRRYFPNHIDSPNRYDVGRRCPRAMVILTLAPGGERFYSSLLKTIESISMHESTTQFHDQQNEDRIRKFLYNIQLKYEDLCKDFIVIKEHFRSRNRSQRSLDTEESMSFLMDRKKFSKLTIEGVEHGEESPLLSIDKVQFTLPESLLPDYTGLFTAEDINSPMIPLMRALGASHVIRLLSALLCERRVIMTARCPTRLSACMRGAASMLAQGLLTWQHLFVPILPPHLLKYLTVESPYLIGLLDIHVEHFDQIPGIGKVLCINLDTNNMTTFFVQNPALWIPDLLYRRKRVKSSAMSCPEILAQDLDDILKADKRMWAETKEKEGTNDQDARKSFLNFNKNKPSAKPSGLLQRMRNGSVAAPFRDTTLVRSMDIQDESSPDYGVDLIELDCCENEKAEEAVRVALAFFFLFIFGDMGMCLSESRTGGLWLDRKKFLRCKIVQGITEDSSLFAVLAVFSRTLLFQGFVKNRIRDLDLPDAEKKAISQKSLYSTCESFIRINEVDCTIPNIRNIVQRFSEQCPQREIAQSCALVRSQAMSLTSSKDFSGDALKALASLIDCSDEVNGSLGHVMGIIWIRLKETRAQLWKQPLLALYILRNLLLHGPISVIAEANDGMPQIRELRSYYHSKNSENVAEIRSASSELYDFLINRSHLFSERRLLACKRLKINTIKGEPRWVDYLLRRLPFTSPFGDMHHLVCPKGMTASTPIERPDTPEPSIVSKVTADPISVSSSEDKSSLSNSSSVHQREESVLSVQSKIDSEVPTPPIVTPASSDEIEKELNEINGKLNGNHFDSPIEVEEDSQCDNDTNESMNHHRVTVTPIDEDDKSHDDLDDPTDDPEKEAEILKLVEMFNSTLDEEKNR